MIFCKCLHLEILTERPILEMLSTTPNSVFAVGIVAECENMCPRAHERRTNVFLKIQTRQYLYSTASNMLETFVIQRWLSCYLITEYTSNTTNFAENSKDNKTNYANRSNTLSLLHRCRFDSINHYIHKAIILYNIGCYRGVSAILDRAKEKLENPFLMYWWNMTIERYKVAGGEYQPLLTVTRRTLCQLFNMKLTGVLNMKELFFETHSAPVSSSVGKEILEKIKLSIEADIAPLNNVIMPFEAPPKIMILFLEYICLSKLGRVEEKNQTLKTLSSTVNNDNGYHILNVYQSVAWELLGICQQMEGNFEGACHSYLMALRQDFAPYKRATCIRLCTILVKFLW